MQMELNHKMPVLDKLNFIATNKGLYSPNSIKIAKGLKGFHKENGYLTVKQQKLAIGLFNNVDLNAYKMPTSLYLVNVGDMCKFGYSTNLPARLSQYRTSHRQVDLLWKYELNCSVVQVRYIEQRMLNTVLKKHRFNKTEMLFHTVLQQQDVLTPQVDSICEQFMCNDTIEQQLDLAHLKTIKNYIGE